MRRHRRKETGTKQDELVTLVSIIVAMIAFIVVVVGSGIGRAIVVVLSIMHAVVVIPATAPHQEGNGNGIPNRICACARLAKANPPINKKTK
jgi:Flp pilus assembly protein TadB